MKLNKAKPTARLTVPGQRLAGGAGMDAANQDAYNQLRRAVMACLLWERAAYISGQNVVDNIRKLIPQVDAHRVAAIALEARNRQKLRHVPLLIVREMARLSTHKHLVARTLAQVIQRPDELGEFLALYWQDNPDQPISNQVKKGLAQAFAKFDAYQLAKYAQRGAIKLRDVMFLTHPRPAGSLLSSKPNTRKERRLGIVGSELFRQLAQNELPVPDTWEVALSAGHDKKETWERLIQERKLPALAFLRNLRNMDEAKVSPVIIRQGFQNINPRWLLPLNYIAAAEHAPRWVREIEALMLRGLSTATKLPGYSILVIDVSGSMASKISAKSNYTRLGVAQAMAILAAEMCEHVDIYATAGSDSARRHETELVTPLHGFALRDELDKAAGRLGGGGIFTRQCIDHIRQEVDNPNVVDRIIIFSDSQDTDLAGRGLPRPFGKYNYIVDVSTERYGINYKGVWTAEVSGWSEHFLSYIAALEGLELTDGEDEE